MTPDETPQEHADQSLASSFERYLQDKGKGRGGDDWTGIVSDDADREPTFEYLDERVFREYARHLAGDRGLKQNTVQTYYRCISAWCG